MGGEGEEGRPMSCHGVYISSNPHLATNVSMHAFVLHVDLAMEGFRCMDRVHLSAQLWIEVH